MEKWFGKIALVTGSSSGIGAAIAESLVKHGVKVIGSARNLQKLQQHSLELQSEKGQLIPFQCDLQKEDEILSLFKYIKEKFGKLHICVNNAGLGHSSRILNGKTEEWRETLNVNVLALSIVTRESVQLMRDANVDDGHIININSVNGHEVGRLPMYSASKFAVTALTEGLRRELREAKTHIRSTSISPGLTRTDFAYRVIPDNPEVVDAFYSRYEILQAKDVADAVVFALSCPSRMDVNEIIIRPTEQPN